MHVSVLSRVLRKTLFVLAWSAGLCKSPFDRVLVDLKGGLKNWSILNLSFVYITNFCFGMAMQRIQDAKRFSSIAV